ncbi:beta-lactamase-like protein [Pelagophyceae sp. CCMP2097]|nr:beta-lactamase-like protein [Pelagophyceae sp. CCMP2097]
MELIVLGTSAGKPTAERNVQSAALKLEGGDVLLFDCGEGTQQQLLKLAKLRKGAVKIGSISRVFVTHLHGDHCFGLPGLLCLVDAQASANAPPIEVVGPPGLRHFLRTAIVLSRTDIARGYYVTELVGAPPPTQLFRDSARPLDDDAKCEMERVAAQTFQMDPNASERPELGRDIPFDGEAWRGVARGEGVDVTAAPVDHGEIVSVGYAYREAESLGKMLPKRVEARCAESGDAPQQLLAAVRQAARAGETSVSLRDETSLDLTDVFEGGHVRRPGRLVVVLGDCRGGGKYALRIATGADVVLHEATLSDAQHDLAASRGHSTPGIAGAFARDCGASMLVLWHFSSRFKPQSEGTADARVTWPAEFQEAARCAGPGPDGYAGDVVIASDLMAIPIPRREAQVNLGDSFYHGKPEGVAHSYEEAVRWWRLAAAQDHTGALYNLGTCHENGHGVPQDLHEALRLYQRAAAKGHADAVTEVERLGAFLAAARAA